jgi:hypothetical protein
MLLHRIKKLAAWFDQHFLFLLSLFLLIFIPLYPKIPLLEAIPGYLVRVRLEDILVLLTGLIWLVQLLRKKIEWRTSFHFLIITYALAGLLSLLVATNLQQTIPLQLIHLSKSLLHYFRYLEYFSLFLFMHAGIKTKQHTQIALIAVVVTLNLIFIYGLGQRYLEWPAFSTMNREFSKGQALVLAPSIKLHSTFGGHYDLAAYLVIILPIITAWILRSKKRLFQVWLSLSVLGGLWLLVESASKTAFIAAAISIAGVIWFSLYQHWGLIKSSLISILAGLLLGGSALGGLWFLQRPTLYKLAPFLRPAGYQVPVDVETVLDETWSENARKYGLSMGIRLDTLWPNALDGFSLNTLTGKGYATLNKKGVSEFTEADSTDNNFLRVLGETGLLGFVIFFGLIILMIRTLSLKLPKDDLNQALSVGFIAATAGLFINSFIIDVFAASKVAFTYWCLAGLTLKSYSLVNKKIVQKKEAIRFKSMMGWLKEFWPILAAGLFLVLLIHKRPFTEYSLVKSFALNASQARYVATTKCWLEEQQLQLCAEKYQPSLGIAYSFYLVPFFLIYSEPAMFYFANMILIIGSAILFDSLIRKLTHNHVFRFLLLSVIFTTPSFYTLPTKSSPANLWLFLILLALNKLFSKIKAKPISKLLNLFMLATTIVHFGLVQYFIGMTGGILASFRDTYRPANYAAIRRANRYLPSRVLENKEQPILLTTIEPILFDLYGRDDYQIQPIETEDLENYQQLIAQNLDQELFITNANTNQDFEEYKHQFGIQLKEIDCRHKCNYYQLLTEEVDIPEQPQTWNNLSLPTQSDEVKFMVVGDQLVADIGSGLKFTSEKNVLKQELVKQNPDLIFITGNAKDELIKHYGQNFWSRVQPELNVPIVTVYEAQQQVFAIGESWYITLDAISHHTNPAQNVFLYDTLLQLEKHPEVKNVYFISDNDQWLQPHPDNYYFWEDFPKQLEKFKNVKFEFRFNNNNPSPASHL